MLPVRTPAVNDAPSFNVTNNIITVDEDALPYNAAWVTAFSAGAGEEQNVTFSTACDGDADALFSKGPSVDDAGKLAFTLEKDAYGSSECNVTLTEEGAGGSSSTQPLSIRVTPKNDPPRFTAGNATISVPGDSAAYNDDWATNISAGPREEGQKLNMSIACSNSALFSNTGRPAIEVKGTTGVLSFTPEATQAGSTNCTVTLADDDGEGGGLTATAQLTIVVEDGEAAAHEEDSSCSVVQLLRQACMQQALLARQRCMF